MTEFTYEFEELEIAPGIMASGEADFVKLANGRFEMTALATYWYPKEKLRYTDASAQIWSMIAEAFDKYESDTGRLSDACEKEEREEFDPDEARDRRLEYIRIGLL